MNRYKHRTKKGKYFNCIICGKEFYRMLSDCNESVKYCSHKCFGIDNTGNKNPYWKGKVSDKCDNCGKAIEMYPSAYNPYNTHFCNFKCSKAFHNQNRKCVMCDKEFQVRLSDIKKGRIGKFCSHTCSNIFRMKYNNKNKDTYIELKMEGALLKMGIDFKKQKPLCNKTISDFYLPKNKIAIYCDGSYWHSLPKAITRDIKVNNILTERGYKVLRFTETDINLRMTNCIGRILYESK
jgi:very-short-patch-repair endonuclease